MIYHNNITSFKGRSLELNKTVEVYRNLNRKGVVWSIKQGTLVVGHAHVVSLSDAIFKVNISGQQRARRDKVRNVHARIVGYIKQLFIEKETSQKIYYNPYTTDYFSIKVSNEFIHNVHEACLNQKGVIINK